MQIGSEMAALQEKTPKMDPKKRFFWKIPQDFELLKKVPKTYIKRANLAETDISGYEIYLTGPSWEMWNVHYTTDYLTYDMDHMNNPAY